MISIGIGAWIFNVIFGVCIFIIAYALANKETLPKDVVEQSMFNMLIFLVFIPLLLAIFF